MERDDYLEGSELLYVILDGDTNHIEDYLKSGGDPNAKVSYKYTFFSSISNEARQLENENTLIEFSINNKQYDIVKRLVHYGADISTSLFDAIRTDDMKMIRLVVELGAKLDYIDNVGKSALDVAYYQENLEAMKLLSELGLSVSQYGGKVFRRAASHGDLDILEFLLKNGVDINFNKPDMVYPYASTAIIEAARRDHLEIVKWLVEHGADLSLADKYGDRPYTCAVKNKNQEMREYIKQYEPKALHEKTDKIEQLKAHKMPSKLIKFLLSESRRIEVKNNPHIKYIEFHDLINCAEVEWNNKRYIDLLSEVDNYDESGFLVWYPSAKKLATADYEHDTFKVLDSWTAFMKDPSATIQKIFE